MLLLVSSEWLLGLLTLYLHLEQPPSPPPWQSWSGPPLFPRPWGSRPCLQHPTSSRYCTHCGRTNHVVDKCWIKHGKPDWANTVTSGGDPTALEPSPHSSESVTLSREEYEQLLHRPVANSATPPTSSSLDALAALHGKSWMLDSGATTHLTDNRSNFSNLTQSHNFPPVRLADGSYSPISGSGTINPTNHLTLTNVLFAPEFPVNLLSISQLTQKHNCSVTFYPSYCVFQDLQT
ncbi:UNVERIFIED_CONTAM: Retrovirus-related Pol polyprotein from transposon RE1 [Sesamum radiatum]|uniref:Retrovirus-related Pol polyprotein from transposon RE1 n=1 Tax=Sesamum radiatum TaxID=300843 RepID=A0AAW2NEE7_SESRA